MEKHSDMAALDMIGDSSAFFGAMTDYGARFTMPSAQVAMNELSNHDHSRFLTRTNKKVGRTAFGRAEGGGYGCKYGCDETGGCDADDMGRSTYPVLR